MHHETPTERRARIAQYAALYSLLIKKYVGSMTSIYKPNGVLCSCFPGLCSFYTFISSDGYKDVKISLDDKQFLLSELFDYKCNNEIGAAFFWPRYEYAPRLAYLNDRLTHYQNELKALTNDTTTNNRTL